MTVVNFALLAGLAVAQAGTTDDAESGGFSTCIPETYEDALDCLAEVLDAENEARLLGYRFNELSLLHHGFGTGLRNAWLWGERSPAASDMLERGFVHPDDMSSAIITGFWARENGCDYPIEPVIAWYAAYWTASAQERENTHEGEAVVTPNEDNSFTMPLPVCPFDLSGYPPGREPTVVEY